MLILIVESEYIHYVFERNFYFSYFLALFSPLDDVDLEIEASSC